jgi:hypothetical protein
MPLRRNKLHTTRTPGGEKMFTDPHKEAQYTRDLLAQGYQREHAKSLAADWVQHKPDRVPDKAESTVKAKEANEDKGLVPITYYPTPSSNPQDPRTDGAGYDVLRQIMRVEWGDGGKGYYYYNITPQEYDSFLDADSPGRWINAIGNSHEYGPIGN